MKQVDVIFFVEHVDRELDSIRKIAQSLSDKGYSSVILSVVFHSHLLLSHYQAKIFAFPYVMGPEGWPVKAVNQLYGDKVTYVNMNWEQLLSPSNMEYKKPRTDFQRNGTIQLAWFESFAEYLRSHGVIEDHIYIVGNPAHQLLKEQLGQRESFRQWLSGEFGFSPEKRLVFFPMNYGWAFTSDTVIRRKIAAGYDESIAWEYKAFSERNLQVCLQWLRAMTSEFSDTHFIIRPHPSVSCDQWSERFSQDVGGIPSNVLITKFRSVREWLPAVDGVFTSWSTVAWDARNAGIPAYLMAPYPRPAWLNTPWNDVMPNLRTEEDFQRALLAIAGSGSYDMLGVRSNGVEDYAEVLAELATKPVDLTTRRLPTDVYSWTKILQAGIYNGLFRYPRLAQRIDQRIMYDWFIPEMYSP